MDQAVGFARKWWFELGLAGVLFWQGEKIWGLWHTFEWSTWKHLLSEKPWSKSEGKFMFTATEQNPSYLGPPPTDDRVRTYVNIRILRTAVLDSTRFGDLEDALRPLLQTQANERGAPVCARCGCEEVVQPEAVRQKQ